MNVSSPQLFTNALHNKVKPQIFSAMDADEKALVAWVNEYEAKYSALPTLIALEEHRPDFVDKTFITEPLARLEECFVDTLKKRVAREIVAKIESDLIDNSELRIDEYQALLNKIKEQTVAIPVNDMFSPRSTIPIPMVKTQLLALDTVLNGGFREGTFNVIAGRPAVGKTWLLSTLATNIMFNKKRILYITSEMTPSEIKLRIDSQLLKTNYSNLYTEEHIQDLEVLLSAVKTAGATIVFNEQTPITVSEIDTIRAKNNIDVVMVDNLYLLKAEETGALWERVKSISDKLKALALSSKCVVIATTQQNRTDELAYSDAITQNADFVGVVYREQTSVNMSLEVTKNRYGFGGVCIPLQLDVEHGRIKMQNETE